MLNCRDATCLLSESQERTLSLKERLSLKMHVMMCSGCRNFSDHMHKLHQIMHAYAKGEDVRSPRSPRSP
ncbi:MAG TPA: zf-HC2 domain-containing protein [Rhodocyclaceae bacterium]|nr:zf-HC2 domain-containing protein [Rhodocyclaceae bacterium]